MSYRRPNERAFDALRPARIELGAMKYAEGSALVEMGDTRVLVSASVTNRVPPFLIDSGKGWVTAEYAMLPRATHTRSRREVSSGRPSGRSSEIQRLIGRSLRSVVDLKAMSEKTVAIDCDVIQADGGTRTASITGAYVALAQAFGHMLLAGDIERWPLTDSLAAISVGVVEGVALLDLEASEDQRADVDMNVVGSGAGNLTEVQGTGEKTTFSRAELDQLLDLAQSGITELVELQKQALSEVLAEVDSVLSQGKRRAAAPKDEKKLWGRPE